MQLLAVPLSLNSGSDKNFNLLELELELGVSFSELGILVVRKGSVCVQRARLQ